MRDAILKMLADRPGASFAELCRDLPGFAGEFAMPSKFENVVLWDGVSGEAIDTLAELNRQRKVHYQVTTVMTYMLDGAVPGISVAKKLRAYKSLRWLPVTVHLVK